MDLLSISYSISMKKKLMLLIGIISGALSWAIVPLVSKNFEPYDSDAGFYLGQFIMSIGAFLVGYKFGFKHLIIYMFGCYLGMNLYPYVVSSAFRAWLLMGLFSSLFLCIFPILFGISGKVVKSILNARRKSSEKKTF